MCFPGTRLPPRSGPDIWDIFPRTTFLIPNSPSDTCGALPTFSFPGPNTSFFGGYVSRLQNTSKDRAQNRTQAVLPEGAGGRLAGAAPPHTANPGPQPLPVLWAAPRCSASGGLVPPAVALETIIASFLAPDPTQREEQPLLRGRKAPSSADKKPISALALKPGPFLQRPWDLEAAPIQLTV